MTTAESAAGNIASDPLPDRQEFDANADELSRQLQEAETAG
jgi:hypothetical protein